jgi:hypothetical protein
MTAVGVRPRPGAGPSRAVVALSWTIVGLAFLAAAIGLSSTGGPGQHEVTSIRGADVTLYGEGLYRYDTFLVGAGNLGTDAATLLVEIPLLVLAVVLYRRRSLPGHLLLAGTLGYFLYYYASMTFATAYNRLFPVYVALLSASLAAFVLTVAGIDATELAERFPTRPSRRVIAAYLFGVGAALTAAWLPSMVAALFGGGVSASVATYTTEVTWALDLGIVTPVAVAAGVLLLRRAPAGYLLAAVMLVLNVTIGVALMAARAWQLALGVPMTPAEVIAKMATFAVMTLVAAGILAVLLRRWTASPHRHSAAGVSTPAAAHPERHPAARP